MTTIPATKRDLRTSADLSADDAAEILSIARTLKRDLKAGGNEPLLKGKSLAMVFEKPSLRTRCTFELGMVQLGGHAVYLPPNEIGLGKRESVADVAHCLERWFDMIMARTFSQKTVDELARHCKLPVINALSDYEHPCQALADYLKLTEHAGDLRGYNLTYIGDGNNICHSLMHIGVMLGMNITVSTPAGFEPAKSAVEATLQAASAGGGSYTYERDPRAAVRNAQAIYTDVWASMGQEHEAAEREKIFAGYMVNAELVAHAPKGAFIMHDLPAHRGSEIAADVIDGPNSIIFDEAENRLHAQKAVMVFLDRASQ
ncbi:ornithine carbamoyltransferase [bacterium]|nr:ornithine carbamoyltransferase [bacterium]